MQPRLFDLPPAKAIAGPNLPKLQAPLWTAGKAGLVSRYCYLFQRLTKHGNYIDGFAGPQAEGAPAGSWCAGEVVGLERQLFRRFLLVDRDQDQVRALEDLKRKYPSQNISVVRGDFNKIVDNLLRADKLPTTEAAFCLLDQRAFECHWATLEKLATYKEPRIELFYFLAAAWMDRGLKELGATRGAQWWGRGDWRTLLNVEPGQRPHLFAARLRDELGYAYAKPFPIYGDGLEQGRVMFHMIHASDHPRAPVLMVDAYNHAVLKVKEVGHQLDWTVDKIKVLPPHPGRGASPTSSVA